MSTRRVTKRQQATADGGRVMAHGFRDIIREERASDPEKWGPLLRAMESSMKKLTKRQQATALALVAAWLGPQMRADGKPVPTGAEAAYRAEGPQLVPDWDWPVGGPTPTILLEGGPEDWAVAASWELRHEFAAAGIFAEPWAGWALCLYRAE